MVSARRIYSTWLRLARAPVTASISPTRDLGPETVWSYDLGLKAETDNLEFEIFAFYMDYSDKITSVFTGETTADGRLIIRSENRNHVDIYGLETGLYWAVMNDLRLFTVINYTRGDEQDDLGASISRRSYPAAQRPVGPGVLLSTTTGGSNLTCCSPAGRTV